VQQVATGVTPVTGSGSPPAPAAPPATTGAKVVSNQGGVRVVSNIIPD
jgi:hypothetical protein